MKKHVIAIMLFCTLLLVTACSAGKEGAAQQTPAPTVVPMSEAMTPAEGSVVFSVKNSIGGDIYELHVSPNSLDTFGDDILGKSILKLGETRSVSFIPQDTYSYWDIRVLTENGNIYTWQNIEFGKFSEIELRLGDSGPDFSTK